MTNLSSYTTIPRLSAPSSFGWHPMIRSWLYDVSHVTFAAEAFSPMFTVRDREARRRYAAMIASA